MPRTSGSTARPGWRISAFAASARRKKEAPPHQEPFVGEGGGRFPNCVARPLGPDAAGPSPRHRYRRGGLRYRRNKLVDGFDRDAENVAGAALGLDVARLGGGAPRPSGPGRDLDIDW